MALHMLSCLRLVRLWFGVHGKVELEERGAWRYLTLCRLCLPAPPRAASKPPLNAAQLLKLKQLTVASLAAGSKELGYGALQVQLGFSSMRELEDFIISDCMNEGIVAGKLDQQRQCLQVHSALGRDVRPAQLEEVAATLQQWLGSCGGLLTAIEERVKWAGAEAEAAARRDAEAAARQEEARKSIKADLDLRAAEPGLYGDGGGAAGGDYGMEHLAGGAMEDRTGGRSKRRR